MDDGFDAKRERIMSVVVVVVAVVAAVRVLTVIECGEYYNVVLAAACIATDFGGSAPEERVARVRRVISGLQTAQTREKLTEYCCMGRVEEVVY